MSASSMPTRPRAPARARARGRASLGARGLVRSSLCAALVSLTGCSGDSGGPATPSGPAGSAAPSRRGAQRPGEGASGPGATSAPLTCRSSQPADVGESVLHRLTKLEYALTVKELLALSAAPDVEALPDDTDRDGFRTVSALHTLSAQHL